MLAEAKLLFLQFFNNAYLSILQKRPAFLLLKFCPLLQKWWGLGQSPMVLTLSLDLDYAFCIINYAFPITPHIAQNSSTAHQEERSCLHENGHRKRLFREYLQVKSSHRLRQPMYL